ncbi:hypothetical protein EMA8858_00656 [Emticicia aquatica]|jgi:hypothetical protein|uniref:DUF3298/DUF4163 domain-containing protein n=1 Tax=Emticicia aquatica TaxID=1681835 RepID=A0ABN8ENU6_9BACT|nr:DUF3298 and DUF4163 domain-containing protein [Emticicia aquatica]CAH0994546.1 hypothetical protein EMA8858_00656 [Emticicia aquatica]
MKNILLLFLCSTAFVACQSSKESQTTDAAVISVDSVTYNLKTAPKISAEGDTSITSISIKYPKLTGGDETVIAKINAQIEQLVKNEMFSMDDTVKTTKTASVETLAQGFIKEYETYTAENADLPSMGWDYYGFGDTLLISPKVISIYYNVTSFTGGAHGNSNTSYLNFNAKTGDLLKLTDIVSDTTALKKLAEMKFEVTQKQFAKDNDFEFNKSDYFWGNPFFLPANIAITKTGLTFLYNPYEAAAYALGPISFSLTWEEVGLIARKDIK